MQTRLSRLAAITLVVTVASAPLTAAEPEPTPGSPSVPVPGQLDNGLVSITKLQPGITRVFSYEGDFWTRGMLFGDLSGARTDLYDKGFTFDATLTQVLQGVASGGNVEGTGGAYYNGLVEVNATLDTAKAGLWSGGLIFLTGMASYGKPITDEAGNISPVNMTALWPVPFEDRTELTEYYLGQGLPGGMFLAIGRIDATNFLDKSSFANNPETQFLNASLNNQLMVGEFISFSSYGALLLTPVNESLSFAWALFDPETLPGDYAGVWKNWGGAVAMDLRYQINGLSGIFNPVFIYASKDAVAFDNDRFVTGLLTDNVPFKDGNWTLAITGEQYLWTPPGSSVPKAQGGRKEEFIVPTQDFGQNQPGIGLFYRFAYAPADRNPFNIAVSGGIGGRGVVPGRPYDRFGLGAYAMFESDDLQDQPFVGGIVGDEVGVEAFYNFAITPALQLTFDVQYIQPGITGNDDGLVLGTRLFTRF